MMIVRAAALSAVLYLAGAASAVAAPKPDVAAPSTGAPAFAMYVGNSFFYYNNGLPSYVTKLADGMPADGRQPMSGTMVTIGGSGFDWHDMESYFRPHAIGYYHFDKDNVIVFNRRNKPYDAVIMMDCSQCPIHPQLAKVFVDYAKKNAEIARKHDVEPILFMSWAYKDKPDMIEGLSEAYTKAGNENHELVIPAGLAFARVIKERPDLELYQPDKRHPALIGTYLAAATVFAALTGKSAEPSSYTAGIDQDLARYLRDAAWRAAQDYYHPGQ
ncbi:MAG: hypothetical protein KGM42_17690 [Hyphomicrobiales bacterium]|nr:hypothetical protein [Hyphomicrobiales bacterium]